MRDVVKLVSETDTIKCSQFIERSVFFQTLAYGKSVTLTFGLLSRKLPKTRHCGGLIRQLRVRSECDQTCLLNGSKHMQQGSHRPRTLPPVLPNGELL